MDITLCIIATIFAGITSFSFFRMGRLALNSPYRMVPIFQRVSTWAFIASISILIAFLSSITAVAIMWN